MTAPIALQLYSVRDDLAKDFEGVIRKVAGMGYPAVETAGFPDGVTPKDAAVLFKTLGLEVVGAHTGLPIGDNKNQVLDTMATIGTPILVCPWLDPKEYFASRDGVKRVAAMLNEANATLQAEGLTLAYHNHDFEYKMIDGEYGYRLLAKETDPGIMFEVDAYWVKVAGVDPVEALKELGDRVVLLHVKDGPGNTSDPMLAVGEGVMDYTAIIPVVANRARAMIVELDRCGTDMLEAVQKSYTYVIGKGLARGNKS